MVAGIYVYAVFAFSLPPCSSNVFSALPYFGHFHIPEGKQQAWSILYKEWEECLCYHQFLKLKS